MNDEHPCTWIEDAGMWLGAFCIPFFCIALGLLGPDISDFFFS
jgi:hypothetical protein